MKKRRADKVTRRLRDKTSSSRVAASPRSAVPIVTLLTDFGTTDYFVGAVKGAILSVNPSVRIVDITHDVPAHDVEFGAFTLLAAYRSFPAGTVHVAVVDPGVGSSRRGILIRSCRHYFVGPDNGILSYVCDDAASAPEVFHLNRAEYFRQPVSNTFHGRDVFAPVAAALAAGADPDELGTKISNFSRLPSLTPASARNGDLKARIIHIDRFGNCVTNITRAELTPEMVAAGARLKINQKTVKSFRDFFAEAAASRDQLFGIWGSAGFLEIAAANKSAAKLLKARRGDAVIVSST